MSAFYKDSLTKEDFAFYSIPELLKIKEWNQILIRLNSLRFQTPYSDKRAIIECKDAPDWLKTAAFVCGTIKIS